MKKKVAFIYLNGIRDHKEPWDYDYCINLVKRLDPEGKSLRVVRV